MPAIPEVRDCVVDHGVVLVDMTPQAFDAYIGAEIAKWYRLVERLGISAEYNDRS